MKVLILILGLLWSDGEISYTHGQVASCDPHDVYVTVFEALPRIADQRASARVEVSAIDAECIELDLTLPNAES